jgi:hypothetical protein
MQTESTSRSTHAVPVAAVIGALILGAFFYPALTQPAARSKEDVAQIVARKMASLGTAWSQEHAGACPTLADITPFMNDPTGTDMWGALYRLRCGAGAPDGARGIAVDSAGPDGRFDTDDDIASWR